MDHISKLPEDILQYIITFFVRPSKQILKWIDQEKLSWDYLSEKKEAISILEKHPERIYWPALSKNPGAIHILK